MEHIFLIIVDTASEFNHEIKVHGAYTNVTKAIEDYKPIVEKARALAKEMNYVITESVGDLSFESYEDGCFTNHYNVRIERVPLTDSRTSIEKMRESHKALLEIRNSGYIPYTSPSPSSTERTIKSELNKAINYLDGAIHFHEQTYGK